MAKKAIKGRQARKTGGCSSGKPKPKPDRMARPGAEVKPPRDDVPKPRIPPKGQK